DTGRPLGLAVHEYSNHLNQHLTDPHHDYHDSNEYDYGEYGDEFDIYGNVDYNDFPDYVYDDYADFEDGRISSTHEWNDENNYIDGEESEMTVDDREEARGREDKHSEMKEMSDTGDERHELGSSTTATDDEDLIEGSGVDDGKYELTWSVWSGCSTSCDGGVRIRSYRCLPNQLLFEECVHAGIETQEQRACNLQPCPSTTPRTTTTTTTSEPTHPEMDKMIHTIPYMTSTDTFSPPPVTATPLDQLMTVTATTTTTTPSPPHTTTTTPITSTTARARVVEMHPLFPTTVVSAAHQPVSEPFYNNTSKMYLDDKHHKPSKMDDARLDNSVWQTDTLTDKYDQITDGVEEVVDVYGLSQALVSYCEMFYSGCERGRGNGRSRVTPNLSYRLSHLPRIPTTLEKVTMMHFNGSVTKTSRMMLKNGDKFFLICNLDNDNRLITSNNL
ncbi:SCO-spondin-like 2, partial [Homarus americanus]